MSSAIRAPWTDSIRLAVEILLRWAAYIIVMSTTITAASTVSVIMSSIMVKPRRSVAWGQERAEDVELVRIDYRLRYVVDVTDRSPMYVQATVTVTFLRLSSGAGSVETS